MMPSRLVDLPSDIALLGAATDLTYDPDAYFIMSPASQHIALKRLFVTRFRPEGVRSAASRMREAAQWRHPKRAPVSIRFDAGLDGWIVIDGNSTVVNACASGWPDIVCETRAGG
jgi:hypothetical protein